MRRFCLVMLLLTLTPRAYSRTFAGTPLVPGFNQDNYITSGLSQITGMAWAKDGADNLLFVSQKTGEIRVVKNGTLQGGNVAFVSVTTNNEAGLDNVIVDPSYGSNKFIYVHACVDIGSGQFRHRVFRFTVSNGGTVGISAGPNQIGPDMPCRNVNHNGSGMAIGADGYLYIGCGNLGNDNHVGSDGYGDEWSSYGSKILRIDRTTGLGLSSNPWYDGDTNSVKSRLFAKGFRNPFGLRVRPGTSDLWLTEVGDQYEQIFLVTAGSDQHWVNGTGPDTGFTGNYDENNTSSSNGYLVPILAYATNSHPYGGCLTRGCFYNGATFPSGFDGNFFFVDYNSGKTMRGVVNASHNGFTSHSEFVTGNAHLVDINVGPDGALYLASNDGGIYKVSYSGATTQNIILSTSSMTITEGGNGIFNVHLAAAPASDVTVSVARTSGDSDVTALPASLKFTPGNWNLDQTVTVSAAQDADSTNDSATITCSSSGLTSKTVAVTVLDDDAANGAPIATITSPVNGDVVSGTNVDFFGQGNDPQGNATLDRAEFYVDGKLRWVDPYDPAVGHFHFGGSHVDWNTTDLGNGKHKLKMVVFDLGGLSGSHQITVTVDNSAGVKGFKAQYYGSPDLTKLKLTRVDAAINFDWGQRSPDALIPDDGFSVRWTGQVVPSFTETYTFFATTDDGVRLWVNDQLIIDHWMDQGPTERNGMIGLVAGQPADVVMEYYENGGGAVAQLAWSSASQLKGTIPGSATTPVVLHGSGGGGGGSGGAGCGATGLEALIVVGFLAFARKRMR